MIGIAGIYSQSSSSESLYNIRIVHETPGVDLTFLTFDNRRLSAGVLMRKELALYEERACRYEDEEYLFMMEGMLAADGPLAGFDRQNSGRRICTLLTKDTTFLSELNGEFVILVYNKNSGRLMIINDRFATRPFFYSLIGKTLRFGSEIKSILATGCRAELDHVGVMEFFCFSHNIGCRTVFKGVKALPPASILCFDGNRIDIRQYWKLSFEQSAEKDNMSQLMREAAQALQEGAAKKLNSRGHLGMGLSGGLDSRLVAALIPSDNRSVFARTYGFTGSQEVDVAANIAGRLNLDHFIHQPRDVRLFSYLHPSVWRTECRVHFTGLKSIIEHGRLKHKFWYNLNGHFGDVLTGKQLRPFMFWPISRHEFIEKVFTHYTWYTYRDENLLRKIFSSEFIDDVLPEVKNRFRETMEAVDERHNWDVYDVWDLTNRQPRFTFSSCAVDNYLFGKASLLTDYSCADKMLQVPGIYRFGQAFYKSMIAKHFPQISVEPNANTGKRVSKSMLKNWADLLAQYRKSQRNRKRQIRSSGGKADLFRRDLKLKNWLLSRIENESILDHVFSIEGIQGIVRDHYEDGKDRSYILGVLSTYLAAHEMFFAGEINKMPVVARPSL